MDAEKLTTEQLISNLKALIGQLTQRTWNLEKDSIYVLGAAKPVLRETIRRLEATPPTTSTESTTGSAEGDADGRVGR